MTHVLTIHWHSENWIDIQIKYLEQHIQQLLKIYSFLNNVSAFTCSLHSKSIPFNQKAFMKKHMGFLSNVQYIINLAGGEACEYS